MRVCIIPDLSYLYLTVGKAAEAGPVTACDL